MDHKCFTLIIFYFLYTQFHTCSTESLTYISTEHPAVTWYDTKYIKNLTLVSRRISRQDPRHYLNVYIHTLFTITNDVSMDFYFYQFLTNRYRPSFVEMHFKFCDMLNTDLFFGIAVKQALGNKSCPFVPGEYTLKNMSIAFVPNGFPFVKGRIYCNATINQDGGAKLITSGYIDMEIKVSRIKKIKKK